MSNLTIGFIGAGNMGAAIMKGLIASQKGYNVVAYDTDMNKVNALVEQGVKAAFSIADLFKQCNYIFLAVKPQVMDAVLDEIKKCLDTGVVMVSIAAGISAKYIRKMTDEKAKVILAMPNTPLLLGEGAVAVAKSLHVTQKEFDTVVGIFDMLGCACVISEDKMKEIIAINGSSPAFIYLYAKGFFEYAEKVGIEQDVAVKLFAQSLVGSAKMITDSGYDIDTLIKMVSSPGGTTLAGLSELYDGNLTDIAVKCCEACTKRAYELSK